MTRTLEASLGIVHLFCSHTAVSHVTDPRAQAWLALRLPAEMVRDSRIIWITRSPLVDADTSLLFADDFRADPALAGHSVVVAAQARREVYDRATVSGYLRGEPVVAYGGFEAPDYSAVIIDWLNALPEVNPRLLDRIMRITWAQAIDLAVEWHDDLAARRDDGLAGSAGTADPTPVAGMPGWEWVHLVTRIALDLEGKVMGHCVGDGGYDRHSWPNGVRPEDWDADAGIWSLRDPEGKSLVTVEIDFDGIRQAQGPGNARPEPETAPAFEALLARIVKPGFPFDVPYWLVREETGATRLHTKEDHQAELRAVGYDTQLGQVFFRPVGAGAFQDLGDVDAFRLDLTPTRRDRRRNRVAAGVETDLQDEEVVREISFTAPAVAHGPSRRARHAMRQPWFRQHERQQEGRRPR